MGIRFLTVTLLLLMAAKSPGQDLIILHEGDYVKAKVSELGDQSIKYKKFDNPSGPVYSLASEKVFMIIFENGSKEVVTATRPTGNNVTATGSGASSSVEDSPSGTFIDARDGHEYKYVKIGESVWMAENLAYQTSRGICYNTDCSRGRFYTLDEATQACPEGWHVATDEDWIKIETLFGMTIQEARKEGWRGTPPGQAAHLLEYGKSGLNLKLDGTCGSSSNSCADRGVLGFYWTSTYISPNEAYIRQYSDRNSIARIKFSTAKRMPVRCVKD